MVGPTAPGSPLPKDTVPVYVPTARPVGFALTETIAGFCGVMFPDAVLTLSQLPPVAVCAVAVNAIVPDPALVSLMFCDSLLVGLLGNVKDSELLSVASAGAAPGVTCSV